MAADFRSTYGRSQEEKDMFQSRMLLVALGLAAAVVFAYGARTPVDAQAKPRPAIPMPVLAG